MSKLIYLSLLAALFVGVQVKEARAQDENSVSDLVFDAGLVKNLVESVENPEKYQILKVAYFGRRRPQKLPKVAGFEMVASALKAETAGTARWFALASMVGYAGLHTDATTRIQGLETYRQLFQQNPRDPATKLWLQRVLDDYLYAVVSEFAIPAGTDFELAQSVLLRGLEVACVLARDDILLKSHDLWPEAIRRVGGFMDFVHKVNEESEKPKPTSSLFLLNAKVLEAYDTDAALELLEKEKAAIVARDQNIERFYEMVVSFLAAKNKIPEAIAAQRMLIGTTGRGRGQLARLYTRQRDFPAIDNLIDEVQQPAMSSSEMYQVGVALLEIDGRIDVAQKAVGLLERYLKIKEPKPAEEELRARLLLGRVWLDTGQKDKAAVILNIDDSEKPASGIERLLRSALRKLHAIAVAP